MSMFSRLKYLYHEGFEVCSIQGYDNAEENGEPGKGTILYRIQNEDGKWRVISESFSVSYDEMAACSSFYLRRILN